MTLESDLYQIERAVLDTASVASFLAAVDRIRRALSLGEAGIEDLVSVLVPPLLEGVALAAVAQAFGEGRASGVALLDGDLSRRQSARVRKALPSKGARSPLIGVDAAGIAALTQARILASSGAEAATFVAPILGHANSIASRVMEAVNRGGNEGVTAVADAAEVPTVWVAETNACVHCLAYSGRVCDPGGRFPGGLTYGKKSYYPDPLATPPLHPHCRCIVEPLNDQSYADALRREADRSVLRGFSLESESMGVRVDAAARLLDAGVEAPKSVKAYAAAAVKRGTFSTRGRP